VVWALLLDSQRVGLDSPLGHLFSSYILWWWKGARTINSTSRKPDYLLMNKMQVSANYSEQHIQFCSNDDRGAYAASTAMRRISWLA